MPKNRNRNRNVMVIVQLKGNAITNWKAFHHECRIAFGFPAFYGDNLNAWVDCLSGLRDDDGMSRFKLAPDEVLTIEILHSAILRSEAPDILEAMMECIDDINDRYVEQGEKPALMLQLH